LIRFHHGFIPPSPDGNNHLNYLREAALMSSPNDNAAAIKNTPAKINSPLKNGISAAIKLIIPVIRLPSMAMPITISILRWFWFMGNPPYCGCASSQNKFEFINKQKAWLLK
jgi:hypothetical protein